MLGTVNNIFPPCLLLLYHQLLVFSTCVVTFGLICGWYCCGVDSGKTLIDGSKTLQPEM